MNSYRLTVCDHYMSPPIRGLDVTYSEFKGTEIRQVPVIRIFGSTIDGKKACLHVHGVFPYIYVPYEGSEPPDRLKYQIAASLDKAINISLGQANATTQHVFKIILVCGIPFYGYHEKEHQFFKIYFFNPNMVKKATELLQNGVVLGKVHQPHEAHVPFILQFMIDYNLQGMNLVNCSHVLPRRHPEQPNWEEDSLPNENFSAVSREAQLRVSCCEIEVDVAASDILNRTIDYTGSQDVVNPGLAALWNDEYQRRREQGRETQPTPQSSQTRGEKVCASEEFYRQRLILKLQELTQSTDDSLSTQQIEGSSIVYAAEVPEGRHLLDASFVDPHTPRRISTVMNQSVEDEEQAGPSTSGNFSQLMDSQDEELLNVLGELAMSQEKPLEEPVDHLDEDSILGSQEAASLLQQQQQQEKEEDDEYFEMTQPISVLLTPNPQQSNESYIIEDSSSDTIKATSDDDSNCVEPVTIQTMNPRHESQECLSSKSNLIVSNESPECNEINPHEISDEETNSPNDENLIENNIVSQTSLNASLLGDLLDEDLWTEVANIPQLDGADDDDDDTPLPLLGKGRRLGARGPLKPFKSLKTPSSNPSPNLNLDKVIDKSSSQESTNPKYKFVYTSDRGLKRISSQKSFDESPLNDSQNSKISQNSNISDENLQLNKISTSKSPPIPSSEVNLLSETIIEKSSSNESLEKETVNVNFDRNVPDTQDIPDTQPIQNETSDSELKETSINKNSDFSMLLDVLDSQAAQNPHPTINSVDKESENCKNEIIEFLKSNNPTNIPTPSKISYNHNEESTPQTITTNSTPPVSEQLVSGLCNVLEWSGNSLEGENNVTDFSDNINYSELDLPEGTTALQLLEEELSQKNDNKKVKKNITASTTSGNNTEPTRIRKSTRLSLRTRVRYRNLDEYFECIQNTKNNINFRNTSTSDTVNSSLRDIPSTSTHSSRHSRPVNSHSRPSSTNPRNVQSHSRATRSHPKPSTSSTITNDTPSVSIHVQDNGSSKPGHSINLVPDAETHQTYHGTWKSRGTVAKRNLVPSTSQQPVKKQKLNLQLELPLDKMSTFKLHITPTTNAGKNMTISYEIQDCNTEERRQETERLLKIQQENLHIRPCFVNLEQLSEEMIRKSLRSTELNSSEVNVENNAMRTEETVNPIPTTSENSLRKEDNNIPSSSDISSSNIKIAQTSNIHSSSVIENDSDHMMVKQRDGQQAGKSNVSNDSSVNVINSQTVSNPSSSQSSNTSSKHEEENVKIPVPIKTQSPLKKRLVSKLKSKISNIQHTKKSVSFSPLDIIIEKSPVKPLNNEETPEKNVPRRKLSYQNTRNTSKNDISDSSIPIVIDSDSDIIENSDEEVTVLPTINIKTCKQTVNCPKQIKSSSSQVQGDILETDSDIAIIDKVISGPSTSYQYATRNTASSLRKHNGKQSSDSDLEVIASTESNSSQESVKYDVAISSSSSDSVKLVDFVPTSPKSHTKTKQKRTTQFFHTHNMPSKKSDTDWSTKNVEYLSDSSTEHYLEATQSCEKCKQSKNCISHIKKGPDKEYKELYSILEEDENDLGITSFYDTSQSQFSTPNKEDSSDLIFNLGTESCPVEPSQNSSQSNIDTPDDPENIENREDIKNKTHIYEPIFNPPTYSEVIETLKENNLQEIKFQEPYYSLSSDVRAKSKEIGGRVMKLISHSACDLQEYQSSIVDTCIKTKSELPLNDIIYIEPLFTAPTYEEIRTYKIETIVEKTPNKEISNLRIQVPQSPGRNDSDNESMSLSPCSDVHSQSWLPISPAASNSQLLTKSPALIHSTPMPKAIAKCMTPRRLSTQSDSCCRIDGPSPLNNTFGFRVALENLQDARAVIQPQQLTVFALELHISTRGELRPDPDTDPVCAAFFLVSRDDGLGSQEMGVIVVQSDQSSVLSETRSKCKVTRVNDEKSLVMKVLDVVKQWDPDILLGYEIEMASWGYLIQRASYLEMNLANLLSRVQKAERGPPRPIIQQDQDTTKPSTHHPASQGVTYDASLSELKVQGRIILNLWRLMKHELALQSYVFENLVYHILHERIPQHSFQTLTRWWDHPSKRYRWLVTDYWLYRVEGCSRLLDQLDLLGRTSELAKVFGIQFYEVLSRGSQFRVESMMLRLAKPRNFVPVSPSIMQRAHMKAPEFVPLILEPESRYYQDPVIVLDFQSLYPSIIIAYNYCFSTCLGRIEHLGQDGAFKFGCTQLKIPPRLARKMSEQANISPCGVGFVRSDVREGVLPRMLREILDTRLMVKKSMKENKNDATLQRVLHARQLGLKLIANVTYGYTSANFSGRMPCIEVGDSVVSKGRETLDRAIQMVMQNEAEWGAQVVYGDTDSMFVLVPGRTRQQAFDIGAQIAAAVTADNPSPIKLKLEKVYQPCILQTKKRYVGYMYESPDQTDPVYEAKGIETVRRDGCPAVSKMLEKSLRFLFETQDVSLVKQYVVRQYQKLLLGRSNMQDLVFAKEFRGFAGYKPGACVPALELTRQWLRTDRRAEPRTGERVPYVVVNGAPGLPLIRLVRSPHELLRDPSLRINAEYYITRAIAPALDRCFSLLGADVHQWYAEMPRRTISGLPTSANVAGPSRLRGTISQYFATVECAVCKQQTREGLCVDCQTQPQKAALILTDKLRRWERTASNIAKVCSSCCGRSNDTPCCSLVCPVLFRRNQADRELEQAPFVRQLINKFLDF